MPVVIRQKKFASVLGFLISLARSATAEGVSWPVAQAVLPPELRGSGRAIINSNGGQPGSTSLAIDRNKALATTGKEGCLAATDKN